MLVFLICAVCIVIGCVAAASLIAATEELPGTAERQADAKRQASIAVPGIDLLK